MMGLIMIFVFVLLVAVPGFYIITRKIFPKMNKRKAAWLTMALTLIVIGLLVVNLLLLPSPVQ